MFLKSLTLSNILSFGPEPHTVELGPLNVIIGPNGSGKSNFIEAIGLLKAAPTDVREPIREGGGVDDWIWKAAKEDEAATIKATISSSFGKNIEYALSFSSMFSSFYIEEESVHVQDGNGDDFSVSISGRSAHINGFVEDLKDLKYDRDRSIFSQLRPPYSNFEVFMIGDQIKNVTIYFEILTGRQAPARLPQKADLPNAHLASDAKNLGLVLNRARRDANARRIIKEYLQNLSEDFDDVDIQVEGGTVQVFAYEGPAAISAMRMSSGTLRFLCLLAILCHPEPPPLICIEEPELGLHPDLIPTISKLLKEASERTQLVVTTHSDILIDTLTDCPEAVLVAEKGESGTRLTRLDPDRLKPWLEKYRLGQLWTSGEIGGTRW